MRKFLSLMMVMFAAVTLAFADDPVQIASGTFNGKNASYTEGWTTTGTGKSRTDCIIIGAGENITSPEVDLSQYESITINIKARRYGTLSGSKADINVTFDGEAIGSTSASGTSATTSLTAIDYTVSDLSTGNFVITCSNATSAGSTHGAGINSIVITGVQKEQQGGDDPQPTTQTLYCQISESWASWPAKYAVYYFKDETDNGWSEFMTAVEGETNLYTTTIPTGYTSVIFVRLDGAATEANWDNKWSQTVNLTIPEGKNLFTVTSGDQGSECDGVWAKYPVVPTYYVAGTMTSWADNMVEMNEGSYTFEGLAAGKYEIKVVDNNSNWLGFDKLNTTASNKNVYGEGTGNIKFVLGEEGDVTVAYDGAKITVTGATIVAPTTVFTVTVPEGTEKAFIAGNFTKWEPVEMTLKEEGVFTYTFAGDAADSASYKYLAGPDWKYVEIKADDTEADNRGYAAADEVAKWKAVPVALKYAKVTKAPINWTGHYILAWEDLKPHSAISGTDFVADANAAAFLAGDTISIMEGNDFAVDIRFSETAGAYTVKLPNGKYLAIPSSSNAMSEQEDPFAFSMAYFKGENQEGVQFGNGDLTSTSTRMMYKNNNYFRSYTNKINNASYKLPTLYRLVDEPFDCLDGPYGVLINGKDVVVAEALAGEEEYDAAGRKQYRAYLNLEKEDIIQIVNTSCGSAWLPAIEEGGMSAHFDADDEMAVIDTTGCFDLYIKMKSGDDKIYIGAGICAGDTVRYYVTGIDENWDEKAIASMKDTLVLSLKAGDYRFKVLPDGSWDGAIKGYDELTQKDKAGLKADNDRNICFTLKEAGDVTIVYNDTVFTVTGKFYVRVPEYKDLYLVPGVWAQEDAKIAAWIYTKKEGHEMEDQWTAFFAPKAEGNDTLTAKIDAEADSIVFVRFNATAEAPSWEEKDDFRWNSIAGDTIDYAGLTYTITDWYAGTWKKYEPAKFYITGDSALVVNASLDKEKAWAPDAIKVTEDSYTFENLVAGDYKLKVTDGAWSSEETPRMNLGFSDLTQEDKAGLTTDNDNNICFTLKEAGNVVVTYKVEEEAVTFTVTGKFYIAPINYYLAGTMTNWKADSIELVALEDKADSLGVTVALKADSLYAFKVVRVQGTDTAWYGLNETAAMTYGNSEGWWIYKSEGEVNQANVGLQTTKEGEYSFALKVAEDHLEVSVAIPAPTPTAAVTGSMNNWEGQIPFELAEDEKTATLFVDNMKSGEYDFRMIIGGQERSNGWWFKRDVLGAAGITGNDENAMKLIADVDGDYTITWFFANDSIHFEFPAPAMFYVTGDSALVKDAAGLEKKDEWNAKAIKAEQDTLVLSLKADQEYKLKLIEDGNWEGGKVYGYDALTQEDKAGLSADNDNNIVFKLNEDGDVKVVYFWEEDTEIDEWKMTFKLIGDFYVEPEIPHTYTVVGPSLPNKWDQTSTASDMTLVEGVYTYVLAGVELKAGAHEYKIVEDHAWNVAFPQEGNASFSVEKDGLYDVTFTLNKETKAYTAVPELKQEIIIAPTAVLMGLAEVEPWTVGESMEVAEGFKTASITKHFVPSKAEGDTLKFKVVINDAWRSNAYLYHRDFVGAAGITMNTEGDDGDMKVVVDVEGDYTFTWTFENDSIGITFPEKPEPVMDDGYYIIGLNGWNVAGLTADDMFWSTGIETNEFSINLTLRLNDEFKVVRIVDDMIQEWYPAEGGNYVVDDHHYGATTVYFRPNYDGNEDWFAGCIYVLPTSTVDIDNLDVNAPAVKILRNGQILIIKGTKTFNVQGQLVR